MITFIKNLFLRKNLTEQNHNDFSDFVINAKSKDKAKIIRQVLREANEEQRDLVERYNKREKSRLDPSIN